MNTMLIATVYKTWIHCPEIANCPSPPIIIMDDFLILIYPSIHPHIQAHGWIGLTNHAWMEYTLISVISISIMSLTLRYTKTLRNGNVVLSWNPVPFWHISLPYIMGFAINVNHQRSQPTSSYCTTCLYVGCLILILVLLLLFMPLVESLEHGYATLSKKSKWEVDMWK
jgi:hypothetical protein